MADDVSNDRPGATALRDTVSSPRGGSRLDAFQALGSLVDAVTRLPVRRGPRAVAAMLLDRFHDAAPHLALGVCIVEPGGKATIIETRLPPGVTEPGRSPTHLFPSLRHERIFFLPGLEGSTLHVASDDTAIEEGSEEHDISTRVATLLAGGIRVAAALLRSTQTAEVEQLRQQLVQAEKLASLGQLVAGVIHELANPLTSIVAYADYLTKKARRNGTDPDDVERLVRIGEAAERILKFSRDLVAYARPANEVPGPVSLHDVISQALAFCEHEFSRYDVAVVCELEERIPPVRGIAGPLTQIFVNLFTNAAHAMSDHGGKLVISARREEERVGVDITDQGVGIHPEVLNRIFEPFFTTKARGEGTGLGLSIVSDIVKAHTGTLTVASTIGEGTTFTLMLPVFEPALAERSDRGPSP